MYGKSETDKKYPEKNSEMYFIIGRKVSKEKAEKLGIKNKIGEGEILIEVPKEIIDEKQDTKSSE